jgi:hypothetical protein
MEDTLSAPENTADHEPILHMLGALSGDSDGYITGMEAAGQRQLVASEVIPTEIMHGGTEETLIQLGFVLGDPVDGDPLFRHATLPAGWSKSSSDHSLWSYLLDEFGRRRCSVFYKAAWYDRSAHLSVVALSYYASSVAVGDVPLVLDEKWATREGMIAAFAELEQREAKRAEELRDVQARGNPRVGEYIAEHEKDQAKYARLRADLETEVDAASAVSPE